MTPERGGERPIGRASPVERSETNWSYLRGHPIFNKDGEWFYADSNTPTIGNERDCGYCGSENSKEGHDGCLGTLPGVMNACCGHGITGEAYVQFSPDKCLHSEDAINEINRMLNKLLSFYSWPGLVCHWARSTISFLQGAGPLVTTCPPRATATRFMGIAILEPNYDFDYHPSLEQARHHKPISDKQLAIPVNTKRR